MTPGKKIVWPSALVLVACSAWLLTMLGSEPASMAGGSTSDGLSLQTVERARERTTFDAGDVDAPANKSTTRSEVTPEDASGLWIRVVDRDGNPVAGIPVGVEGAVDATSARESQRREFAAIVQAQQEIEGRLARAARNDAALSIDPAPGDSDDAHAALERLRQRQAELTRTRYLLDRQIAGQSWSSRQVLSGEDEPHVDVRKTSIRFFDGGAVRLDHEPATAIRVRRRPGLPWRGMTNHEGRVRVGRRFDSNATLRAVFDFPTLSDHGVVWPPTTEDEPLVREVTLQLPAIVRHETRFLDDLPGASKRCWKGRLVVVIPNANATTYESSEPFEAIQGARTWIAEQGMSVQVHAYLNRSFSPYLVIPLVGEPTPDGVERQTVRASDHLAHVTVRILDPTGEPVPLATAALMQADATVWSAEPDGSGTTETATLEGDEHGVAGFLLDARPGVFHHRHLHITNARGARNRYGGRIERTYSTQRLNIRQGGNDAGLVASNDRLRLAEAARKKNDPATGEPLRAWLDLTSPFAPGSTVDLGTITLGQGPILMEGVVVDDIGAPVADATVRLLSPTQRLRLLSELTTDERGAFCFRGLSPWEDLRLDVRAEQDVLSEYPEFARGSQGLRIVLRRTGSVLLHVSVPYELLVNRRTLKLALCSETTGQWQSESLLATDDARIQRLLPGSYEAFLTLHGTRLAGPTFLRIQPGMETPCTAFAGLNLRNSVTPVTIRLVGPGATKLHGRRLRIVGHESSQLRYTPTYSTNREGVETFLVPTCWTDLELDVGGLGKRPIRMTADVQEIHVPR